MNEHNAKSLSSFRDPHADVLLVGSTPLCVVIKTKVFVGLLEMFILLVPHSDPYFLLPR